MGPDRGHALAALAAPDQAARERRRYGALGNDWPSWVWLGVSAENQRWADTRIPVLLELPAAVRFISAEPLLGPIDLGFDHECGDPPHWTCPVMADWLIIGGESGPRARPMQLEWARGLLAQCRESEVSTVPFVKQLGSVLGRELSAGPQGRGHG